MKKRIIAIDCDDVIVGTAPAILNFYNRTYNTHIALENLYSQDLTLWGADDEQTAIDRVDAFLRTDEYQHLAPFEEAVEAIRQISKYHELHIVTGRGDFLAEATEDMLNAYFPGVFHSIEYTNFFGKQSRSKAEVCKQLGADLLIDDHLHHATVMAETGVEVYLFGDYPWNRADELPARVTRVRDWQAVGERLLP